VEEEIEVMERPTAVLVVCVLGMKTGLTAWLELYL
jgi:hypothetical protein